MAALAKQLGEARRLAADHDKVVTAAKRRLHFGQDRTHLAAEAWSRSEVAAQLRLELGWRPVPTEVGAAKVDHGLARQPLNEGVAGEIRRRDNRWDVTRRL